MAVANPGVALTLEGGMGTCHPQDRLFQAKASKTHLFKPFSRSGVPTWIFLKKKIAFQDKFLPIFSS